MERGRARERDIDREREAVRITIDLVHDVHMCDMTH